MNTNFQHETVLINEAVEALAIKPEGLYLDATYGRGGHSGRILHQLGDEGRLLIIDKDPEAIAHALEQQKADSRLLVWQGSFAEFPQALAELGVEQKLDGILLDLGVSSPQLDDAERGFSFQRDGDLDMRMNPDVGMSAAEWVAETPEEQMANVIYQYGEERFSRRIARRIVELRNETNIVTTKQLADVIALAVPKKEKGKHPATRSFQAIRIEVNRELDDLHDCLDASLGHLAKHGRLVVISFHSLEDRVVKRFLQREQKGPKIPKGLPVMAGLHSPRMRALHKPIKPTDSEVEANTRARSAIMRVGEMLK
ncbi:MAG: rRNA small subunit methyltransferase H [uncultured Thiotrichaceae bacterium]|uniref:Ribosomal RNA small subunit methyltransferase H n=1 Tax=uncultured Thiotrichaceae bacterium TaxID=298394 RepID=A0A6S6TAD4_9GAMM|nr:MAG: rRNA small subunit methyltransferase H [uncultured Thiotrichaceae bacterium]